MGKHLAVTLLLVVAFGCSDDSGGDDSPADDSADVPTCDEVFAAGRPVDDVLAQVDAGCVEDDGTADGSLLFSGIATEDCVDGTQVVWNDHGWGVRGSGTWSLHAREDGQLVPPQDVLDACQPPP